MSKTVSNRREATMLLGIQTDYQWCTAKAGRVIVAHHQCWSLNLQSFVMDQSYCRCYTYRQSFLDEEISGYALQIYPPGCTPGCQVKSVLSLCVVACVPGWSRVLV